MERRISIVELIGVVERLPPGEPRIDPRVWYKTQKQHWLGWLREYDGPGTYCRIPNQNRDAKLAVNRDMEPKMLLWLVEAAG